MRFLCISFTATPGLTPTALATLTMSAFRVSPRKLPSPSGTKSSRRANSSAPFSLSSSDFWPSSSTLVERSPTLRMRPSSWKSVQTMKPSFFLRPVCWIIGTPQGVHRVMPWRGKLAHYEFRRLGKCE